MGTWVHACWERIHQIRGWERMPLNAAVQCCDLRRLAGQEYRLNHGVSTPWLNIMSDLDILVIFQAEISMSDMTVMIE